MSSYLWNNFFSEMYLNSYWSAPFLTYFENTFFYKLESLFIFTIFKNKEEYNKKINNFNIDLSSFEITNYTIKDPITFNNYNSDEKLLFLKEEFNGHFVNNIQLNNPEIYYITDTFVYITNSEYEFYFYDILEWKKHFFILNNKKITFYSLCILTNASFLKVDTNNNSYSLKIYFINFFIRDLVIPIEFDSGPLSGYEEYLKTWNYISSYLDDNYSFFIVKIKESILYLKKTNSLNAIT